MTSRGAFVVLYGIVVAQRGLYMHVLRRVLILMQLYSCMLQCGNERRMVCVAASDDLVLKTVCFAWFGTF